MPRIKITYKMAIILATMSFGPMLAGGITGLIPIMDTTIAKNREEVSQRIAFACSQHLQSKDSLKLQKSCRAAINEVQELQSMRIVRYDGLVLYTTPDHSRLWTLSRESPSTLNQVRIPLNRSGKLFAELEIAYSPTSANYVTPLLRWMVLVAIGFTLNFGSFSFFLNRALKALDPKSAVPKRVRNTLDTIVGGVVILDANGKILLANDSFAKSVSKTSDDLIGKVLNELPWRREGDEEWPWEITLRDQIQKTGAKVHLHIEDGRELSFVVNATPVFDSDERVSGALISFEDISILEVQRKNLLSALTDLETSREQIRMQNEVLQELASRDALTGAFNRRALFEKVDSLWDRRNQDDRGLVTIMMDVDHFKKLNDQHGHAVGDLVLKDVVKVVRKVVGTRGTLARYGGEEFCVIMESASIEQGNALANEIRLGIQTELEKPYRVTASIGVSTSRFGAPTIQAQIEQSDRALYAAKHGGRNAVRCWSPELELEAEEAERKKAVKLSSMSIEEHPISYHAVVTLNAAIMRREPRIAAHSHRVAEMSVALARGILPVGKLYSLEIAALLHDIGVIGMHDTSVDDFRTWHSLDAPPQAIQEHARVGLEIMRGAINCPDVQSVLQFHHLAYQSSEDNALSGESIPIGARIVSICNAYDAMTSDLNDHPKSHEEAIEVLRSFSGTRFDPELIEKFTLSPIGWRPYGMGGVDTGMNDQHAVMIGYQLERVIHSFDSRNPAYLKSRLQTLHELAKMIDMPAIAVLIQELSSEVDRKAVSDWESLLPTIEDLVELCLTIQRAYLQSHLPTPRQTPLHPTT